ncbi:hypothetical protein B0J12DRAFT_771697 [Macrophomina phaseolina]|uniref:Uncharacterized protein n=1 Tax=Macrophomina phaseolina TaxID=35725 RepID=A0ABQ8FWB2_9PEZI|nr:hypothetical protein B0J12DRAFT_771697 [Macrophomina phaseolina]
MAKISPEPPEPFARCNIRHIILPHPVSSVQGGVRCWKGGKSGGSCMDNSAEPIELGVREARHGPKTEPAREYWRCSVRLEEENVPGRPGPAACSRSCPFAHEQQCASRQAAWDSHLWEARLDLRPTCNIQPTAPPSAAHQYSVGPIASGPRRSLRRNGRRYSRGIQRRSSGSRSDGSWRRLTPRGHEGQMQGLRRNCDDSPQEGAEDRRWDIRCCDKIHRRHPGGRRSRRGPGSLLRADAGADLRRAHVWAGGVIYAQHRPRPPVLQGRARPGFGQQPVRGGGARAQSALPQPGKGRAAPVGPCSHARPAPCIIATSGQDALSLSSASAHIDTRHSGTTLAPRRRVEPARTAISCSVQRADKRRMRAAELEEKNFPAGRIHLCRDAVPQQQVHANGRVRPAARNGRLTADGPAVVPREAEQPTDRATRTTLDDTALFFSPPLGPGTQ